MIDRNSPESPRKRSFFEEDAMEDSREHGEMYDHSRPSFQQGRERMASRYHEEEDEHEEYEEEDYERRASARNSGIRSLFHGNSSTRHLAYAATGIGALLVVFIGGWMISHSSHQGVPVFEPPKEAAKEKPKIDPTTNTIGLDQGGGQLDANGKPVLAPPPEQANPSALAAQFGSAAPASQKQQVAQPPIIVPGGNQAEAGQNGAGQDGMAQTSSSIGTSQGVAQPDGAQVTSSTSTTSSSEDAQHRGIASSGMQNEQAGSSGEVTTRSEEKKPAAPAMKNRKASPRRTDTEQVRSMNGHVMVQLAALGSSSAAQKQWQTMRRKAPEILGKYNPSIQKVDVKGKAVYRLRIKGFASTTQAGRFCSELKARSLSCTLANF